MKLHHVLFFATIACATYVAAACGGDVDDTIPCGDTRCAGTDLCIEPCCGGAAVLCAAEPIAGECPPGTVVGGCFKKGTFPPGPGCVVPCTKQKPFCAATANCFFVGGPTRPADRIVKCLCG